MLEAESVGKMLYFSVAFIQGFFFPLCIFAQLSKESEIIVVL